MSSLSRDSEVVFKHFPNRTYTDSHTQRHFLQPSARRLIHHYLQRKCGLEVQCRSRLEIADLESRDFTLIFENVAPNEIAVFDSHFHGEDDHQASTRQRCSDQVEFSMPINTCPVIQGDQHRSQIELLPIESTGQSRVSLYSLNDGGYVRRNIFHAPNRFFKVIWIGCDGELPLLWIGGRVTEFQNSSIVNTAIQSAPELIQHLSEFERKRESPIQFDWLKEESPSPIVVHLWAGSISLTCVKGVPAIYERLTVNLCPVNAVPTRLEW